MSFPCQFPPQRRGNRTSSSTAMGALLSCALEVSFSVTGFSVAGAGAPGAGDAMLMVEVEAEEEGDC